MSARCFKDTCSVSWSEAVVEGIGPVYVADVRTDPAGSIACGDNGLLVKIAGPGNGNILVRDGAGVLSATLPPVEVAVQDADSSQFVAVPAAAAAATPVTSNFDLTYLNDSGTEQLVIIKGQFQLHYDVLRESSPVAPSVNLIRSGDIGTQAPAKNLIPFNAQWAVRLKQSVNGGAAGGVVVQHFSTSGVTPDPVTDNVYKSEWRDFTWIASLNSGVTLHYTADIWHDGPEQNLNLSTSPAQQFDAINTNAPARGFRVTGATLHAIPLRVV